MIVNYINFLGVSFLFQFVPRSKSYATLSPKISSRNNTKKSQKIEFFTFYIFFLKDYIFVTCKVLIDSTWTSNEKVMDDLVFQVI